MTGWRIGFAVGRPELVSALTRVKSYTDTGPFLAVQKAGAAALDQAEALVAPIRAELQRRRDAAVEALRDAGFVVEAPKAAMYLWIPLPAGTASAAFATRTLEETGTVVLPGSAFGPAGEGFFRIALTVGADRLREAAAATWPDLGGHAERRACAGHLTFALPAHRGAGRRIAIAASVLVHSLLLFGWIEGRQPVLPRRPSELIVLAPPAEGARAVPMPYRSLRGGRALGHRRVRHPPGASGAPPASAVGDGAAAPGPLTRTRPDTGSPPAPRPRLGIGRLGPGLADGRLWVRPLPLPPEELARRLTKGHVELVDSAVTAIVQGYLDSIASDPSARSQALPSWTKEIAGKKFGIDSKNIYIAGLKIPAAVLALLPIPAGNIDQNQAYNHLMDLRADLQYAAQRAENLEEFKVMIRDMRLRKEREREFERNQRTAPPPADTAAT